MRGPQQEANAAWAILGGTANGPWASRPYLLTPQGERSYAQVLEEVTRAAGFFLSRGLQPGQRVLLAMGDCPELVVGFWAAWWAGLVAVPVAPLLAPGELGQILKDSQAALILADAPTAPKLMATGHAEDKLLVVGDSPPWVRSRPCPRPQGVEEEEVALLLYTSGTTGRMKGVAHSHGNLVRAALGLGPQVLRLTPEDRLFSAARMFFAYGLGNSLYMPAAAGAATVVHPGPILAGVVREVLERFQPSIFFAVPSLYAALLGQGGSQGGRLRLAVSAGEKLPATLWRALVKKLGVPVLDGLGMTETLHHITSNRPQELAPESAGRPLAGFVLQVRDPEGQPVPEGEVGELWVAGPTLMKGYWQQPELTAQVLVDGFFRTGDLVSLREGFVYHHGRRDELIKVGGLGLFPSEVEAVLRAHPAVADAAVVPVQRGAGVVILKALVVPREGAVVREGELLRHCRRKLASFKVPREYEVVGALPRTATGKLRRFALPGSLTA